MEKKERETDRQRHREKKKGREIKKYKNVSRHYNKIILDRKVFCLKLKISKNIDPVCCTFRGKYIIFEWF